MNGGGEEEKKGERGSLGVLPIREARFFKYLLLLLLLLKICHQKREPKRLHKTEKCIQVVYTGRREYLNIFQIFILL